MNQKIENYIEGIFASFNKGHQVDELKSELLMDLKERYSDLIIEGHDDATAFKLTIDSIGDLQNIIEDLTVERVVNQDLLTNFTASNLPETDFKDVKARRGNFKGSQLKGSDFSGADLTESTFAGSDVSNSIFDGANLTDCNLSGNNLNNTHYQNTILDRTNFSSSSLDGAKFIDVKLVGTKLTMTGLSKTTFERCVFIGTDFKYSDLRGICFDGQTLLDISFNKSGMEGASFAGATLKNVSFCSMNDLTKKYYKAIKTINFKGAIMDKLTYAALKNVGANLSDVIIL